MTDIATLGFRAETNELEKAEKALDDLGPASTRAEQGAKKVGGAFDKLSAVGSKLTGVLGSVKTSLVGLAAGMLAAFSFGAVIGGLTNIAQSIDDISKASSKMRENMGNMQALGLAADLAGLNFNELAMAGQRMNKVLGQAIATGKGTDGVFKLIGISAKQLSDMPITERFGALADRLNAMNLTADQTALVLTKLGDRSGALAALFEGGSEGIRQASEMLDRFNGKLTNDQGKQVEAMNDAWTSVTYAVQAFGVQLVAAIAPFAGPLFSGIAETLGGINRSIGWLINSTSMFAQAFRTAAAAILSVFNPIGSAIRALDTLFKTIFGTSLTSVAKTAANTIINTFSGAYQAVAVIWDGLPNVFAAAAYGGAKMALTAINSFVQNAIALFNNLAAAVGAAFGTKMGNTIDPAAYDISGSSVFKGIAARADANAAAVKGIFDEAKQTFSNQMAVDNFAQIGDVAAKTTDQVKPATTAFKDFDNALTGASNAAGGATQKLTELQKIGAELDKIGAPFDQAKTAFDKLTELQKNGIVTGDQYTAMLERIKNAFIATGGSAAQWSKVIAGKTSEMTQALKDFSTNALTQVGDAFIQLAVEGKTSFSDLAKSVISDLLRMMWQMYVVKPLIGSLFGFESGGAFGSGGNVVPFAKGGVFDAPHMFKFAQGGALKTGVLGEAGPEAIMPLRRGRDGSLGVQVHGNGSARGGNSIMFNNQFSVTGGTDEQNQKAAQTISDTLQEQLQQLVDSRIAEASQYGGYMNPRAA